MKKIVLIVVIVVGSLPLFAQLPIDSLNVVDYHVHMYSEEMLSNLFEEWGSFERGGFQIIRPIEDYGNIDSIISDNDAKMLLISAGYAYKAVNEAMERSFVESENDRLAKMVNRYPKRLVGFYGLNPLKDFTLDEIKRCKYELGLHGLKLHFQGNKVDLDNPTHLKKIQRLFSYLSQENIPVLIHNNAWDLDSGKAYAQLFIDSILAQSGPLIIIFAHTAGGGGTSNFTYDCLAVFADYLKESESAKKHKLYFELSGTILNFDYPGKQSIKGLEDLIIRIGPDQFLFGSDYPYRNSKRYITEILDQWSLDKEILKGIIERDIFAEFKK